jgi:hypothetical protein
MHTENHYEEVRFWLELIASYEQRRGEDAPERMHQALKQAIERAIEQSGPQNKTVLQ